MIYDYLCTECSAEWEENHTILNRDIPTQRECPHCGKNGVKRAITQAQIHYNGGGLKSNITRAGSGWNDVLKKVSKSAGSKSTIETN